MLKTQALPISPQNGIVIRKLCLQDTECELVGGSRTANNLLVLTLFLLGKKNSLPTIDNNLFLCLEMF